MKILVTGASKGIGLGICSQLSDSGHDVIGIARSPNTGFPGRLIPCDMACEASLAEVLSELAGGRIDAVVNNAGINAFDQVEDVKIEDFRRIFELNVRAPLQVVSALVPGMKERGFGRIVNIASRAMLGMAKGTSYAASKAALAAMTKCWALELGPHGITANTVAPGPVDTELFWTGFPKDQPETDAYLRSIPIQKVAQPSEVATIVEFFLRRDVGVVTGQNLFACGGLTVGRAGV